MLASTVYDTVCSTRFDDFIPIHTVKDGVDAFVTDTYVEYTCQLGDSYHDGSVTVTVRQDGLVDVIHNPDGRIRSDLKSSRARFNTYSTEEELFMLSTIQDNFDIGLEEMKIFNQIWEYYF